MGKHDWETALPPNLHMFVQQNVWPSNNQGTDGIRPKVTLVLKYKAFLNPKEQEQRKQLTTPLELLTPFILIFVTNFTRGSLWVFRSTFYFKAVYSVLINCSWRSNYHLCPSCVTSSSSSRPQLTTPSPTPLWPSSNSSNSWKLWDFYSRARGGCHLLPL